jgi:hypothetical protein
LLPAHAYSICTLTAETPPVVGRFVLSFTDINNDGIYTPSEGDQFVAGSLVWSGGWSGMAAYTVLLSAPSNAYCAFTNDTGGKLWSFGGTGVVPTTIDATIGLTNTRIAD